MFSFSQVHSHNYIIFITFHFIILNILDYKIFYNTFSLIHFVKHHNAEDKVIWIKRYKIIESNKIEIAKVELVKVSVVGGWVE